MSFRFFALSLPLLLLSSLLPAQEFRSETPAAPVPLTPALVTLGRVPIVQKQVNEVSLLLSVTDEKGHFVEGLKPQDFSIFDNSKQQSSITFFQSQTNLPLDVALVLDASGSMATRFDAEKWTINLFLREVIRHEDLVELFAFNNKIRAMLPVHYNWRQVSRQVKKMKPRGETALYDAVTAAAQWLQQDQRPARRIIILLTDGEENASKTTLDATLGTLLKTGAAVYSVNDGDDLDSNVGQQGETTLKLLALSTGGAYHRAAFDGDVGTAFGKIRKELRSQYAIAYRLSDRSVPGFHYLEVLAGKLYVHCRSGYYAH